MIGGLMRVPAALPNAWRPQQRHSQQKAAISGTWTQHDAAVGFTGARPPFVTRQSGADSRLPQSGRPLCNQIVLCALLMPHTPLTLSLQFLPDGFDY